jgi:LysR family transcriptional regulator, low CO2-responsive transcriptional regulator
MKPGFDHQHLRIFVVLARHLNMRRAAAELSLTPSGVSRSLTMLERSWSCRLFDRTSRGMALSRAGRELLPLAEGVLERLGSLEERLRTTGDSGDGQLRIGAAAALGPLVLPAAVREFRETCPRWSVKIDLGNERQAEAGLRENRFDLALLIQPASLDGLSFELLAEDELQFVVHPLHPWAVERRVRVAELGQRRLILPERQDETFRLVDAYFREEGIAIDPLIEIANEESIKEFIRLDVGVGILPRWMVADEVQRGQLTTLPLGRRRLRRRWGVLTLRGRTADFAEHLFANICGAILRQRIGTPALVEAEA